MPYELDGNSIETTEAGYLVDPADWSEALGELIAREEGIELTDRHRDVLRYLRAEFLENGGNQPMERVIKKAMEKEWGDKLSNKDLYDLFPGAPSKQGAKIAGLPATTRKGGY